VASIQGTTAANRKWLRPEVIFDPAGKRERVSAHPTSGGFRHRIRENNV
jgi:hypothetical protein